MNYARKNGKRLVLTQSGYEKTPDSIKRERKVGEPIRGYENKVPISWIERGYVIEI